MTDKLKRNFVLCLMMLFILAITGGERSLFGDKKQRTGTITGRLLDMYTQRPLPGADVTIPDTTFVTVTNAEGKFIFKDVPVGGYSLKFSFPGMVPIIKTDIIVKSKRTVTVETDMEMIPRADETVTVEAGYFNRVLDHPVNTVSFSAEEIRRAPGAGGDVSRIISSLPSIAQVGDQVNNLAVRGGSSDENLFLVDNIPIPNINHFPLLGSGGGAMSLLNVDFIEDVSFYAGGFSAIYGGRISSVMDLTFREGNRDRFNGQFSLDMSGAGAIAEGPLFGKNGSWMISARRSYLDLLTDLLDAGAAVRYSDLQGKIVLDLSPRHKLTFLGIMGEDKSTVTQEDAAELGEATFGVNGSREYTAGLNWFFIWNDKGYSNTSFSYSRTTFDASIDKTATGLAYLDNLSTDAAWHLRNVGHYTFNHVHKLRFGFDLRNLVAGYDYRSAGRTGDLGQWIPPAEKNIDVDTVRGGAFLEYSLTPVRRLTFNLGVRADYFGYSETVHASPRLSLSWQLSGRTTVGAAAGIFRQAPPMLLMHRNEANKALRPLEARQYSLSFSHLFGASTRLTVEGYHKEYRYFPVDPAQPSVCLSDDIFGGSVFSGGAVTDGGKARSYGVEFVLQKKLKEKIYGMISGSYSRVRYRGLDNVWRNRVFDNQYIFAVQGGYKPNKKWEFSLRWTIAGGVPYTPFDIAASELANSGIYDETRINEARLPAYHSLNLRFDRRYYFSGSNLTFYLSVWNAYNRKNVANYFWNEIESKPDFANQFSILPVFGLEYEF